MTNNTKNLIKADQVCEGKLIQIISLFIVATIGGVIYEYYIPILGGVLVAVASLLMYGIFLNIQDIRMQRIYDVTNKGIEEQVAQLQEYKEFVESTSFLGDDKDRQLELEKIEVQFKVLKSRFKFIS